MPRLRDRLGGISAMTYESATDTIYCYFLERRVPLLGNLWYLPSSSLQLAQIEAIIQANVKFIGQHMLPVFLVKIEPGILNTPLVEQKMTAPSLRKTTAIQAHNSTIHLDLEQELLNYLGSKARRDIRLAMRQSIEVRKIPFSKDASRAMYELMKTVSRGRGSAFIRPYEYYQTFWSKFSQNGQGCFYFAYEDNRPVVGAFIITCGTMSTYKDGGSTPDTLHKKRYSMAVQWQVLQDAKSQGCTLYDLCGTPPREHLNNPEHPYYGIGQFKLKSAKIYLITAAAMIRS